MKIFGCVLALALSLSACATMNAPTEKMAGFQNAVYVVGDASAPVHAMPNPYAPDDNSKMSDDSALKRVYWFFAGR